MAFLLNEYSVDKELETHQIQLLNGLNIEVEYFLDGAKRRESGMQTEFSGWKKSVASGDQKAQLYFTIPGNALPTRSIWQVVLNSSGLNLLNVPTTFNYSNTIIPLISCP